MRCDDRDRQTTMPCRMSDFGIILLRRLSDLALQRLRLSSSSSSPSLRCDVARSVRAFADSECVVRLSAACLLVLTDCVLFLSISFDDSQIRRFVCRCARRHVRCHNRLCGRWDASVDGGCGIGGRGGCSGAVMAKHVDGRLTLIARTHTARISSRCSRISFTIRKHEHKHERTLIAKLISHGSWRAKRKPKRNGTHSDRTTSYAATAERNAQNNGNRSSEPSSLSSSSLLFE